MSAFNCAACGKKCTMSFIRINQTYFHNDCIKCNVCKCNLQTTGYYKSDGCYFCPEDFKKCFGGQCGACNLPISGDRVVALNRNFHKKCFHCCLCRSTFQVSSKVVFAGKKFYCDLCSKSVLSDGKPDEKIECTKTSSNPDSNELSRGQPVTSQSNPEEFQKELLQRLAVQYKMHEPHIVEAERAIFPAKTEKDEKGRCVRNARPIMRPRKLRSSILKERGTSEHFAPIFDHRKSSSVNTRSDKFSRTETRSEKKRRVSALVKAFEGIADNDGKLADESISHSSENGPELVLNPNEYRLPPSQPISSPNLSKTHYEMEDEKKSEHFGFGDSGFVDTMESECHAADSISDRLDSNQLNIGQEYVENTFISREMEHLIFSVNDNYNEGNATWEDFEQTIPSKNRVKAKNIQGTFPSLKIILSILFSVSLLLNMRTLIGDTKWSIDNITSQICIDKTNMIECTQNMIRTFLIKVFTV